MKRLLRSFLVVWCVPMAGVGCRASSPAHALPSPSTASTLASATSSSPASSSSTSGDVAGAKAGIGLSAFALPKAALTPGVADPGVTQDDIGSTICVSGWTTRVRPPESYSERIKVQVMAAYGLGHDVADYELDHLIPLELGGAPSAVGNLWPEPWEKRGARLAPPGTGAESKDQLENFLNRQVCERHLPLAQARRDFATDWLRAYRQAGLTPGA